MRPPHLIEQHIIADIRRHLQAKDWEALRRILLSLHPAEIADIFDELESEEVITLFQLLPTDIAAEVLPELEDEDLQSILATIDFDDFVHRFIPRLDPDDAVDLIRSMPDELQRGVVHWLEQQTTSEGKRTKHARAIRYLLRHKEDTAGALMTTEVLVVPSHYTVQQALEYVREKAREIDEIYTIYTVDDGGYLKGMVALKDLLVAEALQRIDEIAEEVPSVTVDTPAGEIVEIAKKYDLVSLPVVDEQGHLVGRITIDDILEYLQEEVKEDINILTGVTEDVEVSDAPMDIARARLPWLLIGLLGGVLNSRIISQFGDIIRLHPSMAFFMPLIAAMGGNAGIQASAIVVQSLARRGEAHMGWKVITKELVVAFIIGIATSSLIFLYGMIFQNSMALTLTVSIALFSVILIATFMGVLIPLALHKIDIDPAVAMGPFITTLNDLTGMGVYFTIAHLLFNYLIGVDL